MNVRIQSPLGHVDGDGDGAGYRDGSLVGKEDRGLEWRVEWKKSLYAIYNIFCEYMPLVLAIQC